MDRLLSMKVFQRVADEGGFWPAFDSNEDALDTLVRSIEAAGLSACPS